MGFLDSVEKWGDNILDGVENTFKWGVKQGENTIVKTENTFSGIISTPLLILSVGVALFLWNSNAGQVAEASKNIAPLVV